MSEKVLYKEFDQCPICGDPLKKNKKGDGILCGCCGFNITLKTKVSDEDKERLLQANEALRSYEFERAEARYNLIVEDNLNNDEIYIAGLFGKLLSQFGVVYIKDTNGEAIPTFSEYNPNVSSITTSTTYKKIISSKVDKSIKTPYLEKIKALDEIYGKIDKDLKSKSEYDLFICTKISKKTLLNPNERGYTEDSRIADDFYQELRHKGLNVFYSDRCCNQVEYDSQILSALLKSKKILIIATESEYLESAWVQSEWRRWLNFIDCGAKSKDSMILYFPYYEKEPFELPRSLRKVQRYTRLLQVVSLFDSPIKETKKEEKKSEEKEKKSSNSKKDETNPNEAEANYEKACELEKAGNIEEAIKYYMLSANAGYSWAEYVVGQAYLNGDFGLNQSNNEAFKWFTRSHEHGYSYSTFMLGQCYRYGYGVKVNSKKAFKYYKMAAKKNDEHGLNMLGLCYSNGFGCFKNLKKSFEYYKQAADIGFLAAKVNMARSLLIGEGVKKDPKLAMKMFRDGIEKENSKYCKYWLAYALLYNYDNVKLDYKQQANRESEVIKLLTEAAKENHEDAKALLYEKFGKTV